MKNLSLIAMTLILAACGTKQHDVSGPSADATVKSEAPAPQADEPKQDDPILTPGTMATVAECTPQSLEEAPWARLIVFTDFATKAQVMIEFKPGDISGSGNIFPYWLATDFRFFVETDNTWNVDGKFADATLQMKMVANQNGSQVVDALVNGVSVAHDCIVH